MRTPAVSLVGLALLFPSVALAGAELTVAAGVRSGSPKFPIEARSALAFVCVTTPCIVADVRTDSRVHYSAILDVPVSRRWMVEALFTQVDGGLELASTSGPGFLLPETFDSTTAQVGVLHRWRDGHQLRPFLAGAVGATRFETSAAAYDRPIFPGIVARPVDEEAFSGSVAGGVKVGLGRRLALRVEDRLYWHDFSPLVGGPLTQNEASIGLSYRW